MTRDVLYRKAQFPDTRDDIHAPLIWRIKPLSETITLFSFLMTPAQISLRNNTAPLCLFFWRCVPSLPPGRHLRGHSYHRDLSLLNFVANFCSGRSLASLQTVFYCGNGTIHLWPFCSADIIMDSKWFWFQSGRTNGSRFNGRAIFSVGLYCGW